MLYFIGQKTYAKLYFYTIGIKVLPQQNIEIDCQIYQAWWEEFGYAIQGFSLDNDLDRFEAVMILVLLENIDQKYVCSNILHIILYIQISKWQL